MKDYNPNQIEGKWQKEWEKKKVFEVTEDKNKDKFFGLVEFPYPSGEGLHVGHPRSYTAMDVISRKRRMEGYNVLYPIGFDAFGLPTENYAIKTGRPPKDVTRENIANFTRQLKALGFSFDWSRAVDTTDPAYYKWTQWIFLQFFKHGLAYKKKQPINWCPKDKIGLANEEVVDGCCERCGGAVEKRDKEQWMLAITKYADKLLDGLKEVDYISRAKTSQENWIGRSEGAQIEFTMHHKGARQGINHAPQGCTAGNQELRIKVFTTRPDTLFGATYLVIAPEHPLLSDKKLSFTNQKEVKNYIAHAKKKTDIERSALDKEKTGVELKGVKAINPATGKEIPVWMADYVLASYGTGAIMAVPAHDERDWEFANKFGLDIKIVVCSNYPEPKCPILTNAFTGEGHNIESDFLNGLPTKEAKEKMIAWLEEKKIGKRQVNYKLRDWVFSRQRYWGEPIPLVYCEHCAKWVPLPEKDLPLTLPKVERYEPTDTGESPLATMTDWVNTTCPKCKGPARRETDTMPNWAGSSWYFLRYCDPKNDKKFASMEKLKYWMGSPLGSPKHGEGGVDWYNGGMEHTVLHLLYSRFWNIFLHDIGLVPVSEPYRKRTSHGMILASNGEKMSKSRGNVVNPDEMVEKFGADALRTYILFMGPFDQAVSWDTNGLSGARRFLDRVWRLQEKIVDADNPETEKMLHKTIKKVSEDIEKMSFNTAVSEMMIFVNVASKSGVSKESFKNFLKLLSVFAPHIAEELWSVLGDKGFISLSEWPKYDEQKIVDDVITLAIQVNGKLRGNMEVSADITEDEVKKQALAHENVQKWLERKEPKKVIYVKGKLVSVVV